MNRFFRKLTEPLTQLYDEGRLDRDGRRSLNAMMAGNLFGNLNAIVCAGGTTAMVGLAGKLGATDSEFGLLVAIPQIAALLQLPFSILVHRTHKRKIYLLTLGLISRMMWIFFGMMPALIPDGYGRAALYVLILLVGVASCLSAVINVCWFPWFSDIAPIHIRGRWLSLRDTLVSVANMLFGLLVAQLLDVLPEDSKYAIVFGLGGLVGVLDMVCFGFAKEVWKAPRKPTPLKSIFGDIMRNKTFLRFLLMWTAWCFTANLAGAYLTPYAMNSMGMNFMQMMIFGTMTASLFTIIAVPRWGQALDQFGARNVMLVACIGASLTPAAYLLSTPGSVLPTFLHNAAGALFWSGSNLAANAMQLSSSPDETRPTYIALFSCVTALAGTALGTMLGGAFLDLCHANAWFVGSFDRYKALVLLSTVLRFGITLLLVPSMKDGSSSTVRDLLRWFLPRKRRS